MAIQSIVRACGIYLPETIVTNQDLECRLDTSDAWIQERTGIRQRHIAAEGELTSHLGAKAARNALQRAGLSADDVDAVIVATTTPDDTMPSTAVKIQHALGMTRGFAFDVSAACSGFIYALSLADNFIRLGQAKRILVIGAETYSRIIDWEDRSTCILFGDGAGAFVLEAMDGGERGILYTKLYSDGQYAPILRTTGGVSSSQRAGVISMQGKEVFRHAVAKMSEAVVDGFAHLGLAYQSVDWVIPHQANVRILQAIAKKLELPEEKLISTVAWHANTSAASIPLAAFKAAENGALREGNLVAMPALGSGLTWGACILRW